MSLDANEIIVNLWQGSRPPTGSALRDLGFKVLVLCAQEWQPAAHQFQGVRVIYAPNDDDPTRMPTREELLIAVRAARDVAQAVRDGQKVLVTCWQGWNRSGLVSALALYLLTGSSGVECRLQVQLRRDHALVNRGFQRALDSLSPIAVERPSFFRLSPVTAS